MFRPEAIEEKRASFQRASERICCGNLSAINSFMADLRLI